MNLALKKNTLYSRHVLSFLPYNKPGREGGVTIGWTTSGCATGTVGGSGGNCRVVVSPSASSSAAAAVLVPSSVIYINIITLTE